jgi:hypothetical protein
MTQQSPTIRFEKSMKSGLFEVEDPDGVLPGPDRGKIQEALTSRYEDLHHRDGQRIEIDVSANGKARKYQFLVRTLGGHRPGFELVVERRPIASAAQPVTVQPGWPTGAFLDRVDHLVAPLRALTDSAEDRAGITCLDFALSELRRAAGDDPDRFALALLTGFMLVEYHRAAIGAGARRDIYLAAIAALDRLFEAQAALIDRTAPAMTHNEVRRRMGWTTFVLSHVLGLERDD